MEHVFACACVSGDFRSMIILKVSRPVEEGGVRLPENPRPTGEGV